MAHAAYPPPTCRDLPTFRSARPPVDRDERLSPRDAHECGPGPVRPIGKIHFRSRRADRLSASFPALLPNRDAERLTTSRKSAACRWRTQRIHRLPAGSYRRSALRGPPSIVTSGCHIDCSSREIEALEAIDAPAARLGHAMTSAPLVRLRGSGHGRLLLTRSRRSSASIMQSLSSGACAGPQLRPAGRARRADLAR